MKLLDLFCGAGGAATGYYRAGFTQIVGVDVEVQPRYPFEFVHADALAPPLRLQDFDAIHASPPCQGYSRAMKHLSKPTAKLLEATRDLLDDVGRPYIIENVDGAPIGKQDDLFGRMGVQVCGTALGLRVYRHRLFESNLPLMGTHCDHRRPALNPHNQKGRDRIYAEFGRQDPEIVWRRDMGVEWMHKYEAREAIPPIYTEYLGKQLLAQMQGAPEDVTIILKGCA